MFRVIIKRIKKNNFIIAKNINHNIIILYCLLEAMLIISIIRRKENKKYKRDITYKFDNFVRRAYRRHYVLSRIYHDQFQNDKRHSTRIFKSLFK